MPAKKKTENKEKAVKKEAKEKPKKAKKEPAEKKAVKKETAEKEEGRKIKGIIFDFWGTLVENGVFPSPIKKVMYTLRLNIPFSDYVVVFEETFMLGKFKDLYEGFTKVCKTFGVEPHPKM